MAWGTATAATVNPANISRLKCPKLYVRNESMAGINR